VPDRLPATTAAGAPNVRKATKTQHATLYTAAVVGRALAVDFGDVRCSSQAA
jgi:hypothetical protein